MPSEEVIMKPNFNVVSIYVIPKSFLVEKKRKIHQNPELYYHQDRKWLHCFSISEKDFSRSCQDQSGSVTMRLLGRLMNWDKRSHISTKLMEVGSKWLINIFIWWWVHIDLEEIDGIIMFLRVSNLMKNEASASPLSKCTPLLGLLAIS